MKGPKRFGVKKLLTSILPLTCISAAINVATISASAASISQDGIEASLNVTVGESDESINATLMLTNTNTFDIEDISFDSVCPDGYVLGENPITSIDTLKQRESFSLDIVYKKANIIETAPTETTNSASATTSAVTTAKPNDESKATTSQKVKDSPATGDNFPITALSTILLTTGITATLCIKKKKGKKFLSLMLVGTMCGSLVAELREIPATAAVEVHSFSIEEFIDGNPNNLSVKITLSYKYHTSESEEDIVDTDGDNVEDYIEDLFGSDPNSEDTDGDGLSDYVEIFIVDTDPTIPDTDGNGASDADEDYDGDEISNIDEINRGLNPAKKDTDSDGLNDYDEIHVYLTLPDNYDTDGDSISDGNEIILGLDPCNPMSDGSTPDAERTFKQTLDSSNVDESLMEDNIVVPYISGNVPDVINDHVHVDSVEIYSLEDNRAAIGKQIEVSTDYSEGTELYINFTLNEDDERADYYMVCQFIDNEFVPCETLKSDNTISALVNNGTYFVVDAEELMIDLDIPITKYKSMSLAPMTFSIHSNDDNTYEEHISRSNEIPKEWHKEDATDISETTESEDVYFENIQTFNFANRHNMKTASSMDMKTSGQADIVFVIDSTGSMYDAIDNVVKNIDSFVDTLYYDYSVKANFALIDYKDIEYDEETILTYNGTDAWFSDVSKFKEKVNSIYVDGGGDDDETPIDALGMAYDLNFRHSANKFVILVTDAGYKVTNNYGIESMESMAKMFEDSGIVTSVITSDYFKSDYEDLFAITGGVYGDIYGDFKSVLLNLSENIGEVVNDGSWVLLSDYQFLKLNRPLDDSGYSSDSDSISDKDELGDITVSNVKPYIDWILKNYGVPLNMYTDATTVNVYKYKSNPLLPDSDFDGIDDGVDTKLGNNTFPGNWTGNKFTADVKYTMDFRDFCQSPENYSQNLCETSLFFCNFTYADCGYKHNSEVKYKDNNGKIQTLSGKNTKGLTLMDVHFEDVIDYKLDTDYKDDDISEVVIGHHRVKYNGYDREVVAIMVRGTNSTIEEWSSNFDMGDRSLFNSYSDWKHPDNHKGFDVAANRIKSKVDSYVRTHIDSSDVVYWTAGHSRGAAISNIIAATLIDEGKKVFSYNFAVPNTTINADANNAKYNSIFNVVNGDDFVPKVPLSDWHFKSFGRTAPKSLDSSMEKEYHKLYKGMSSVWYNQMSSKTMNKLLDAFGNIGNDWDSLYKYTCKCHGDGSDDSIKENLGGSYHITKRAKAHCKIETITHWWRDDTYTACQRPAFLMQVLAETMGGGKTEIVKFELAKKYEGIRGPLVKAVAGGIEDPHFCETYYIITQHISSSDFT